MTQPLVSSRRGLALGLLLALLIVALAAIPALAANQASTPVSDGGVTPYIIDGAIPGGNRTCAEVGLAFFNDADYYQFSSGKKDYPADFPANFSPFTVTVTNGTYVAWSGNHGGLAVIVKGTADANVYVYDQTLGTFLTADSGLASPPAGQSGTPGGLSNLTLCWNPPPPPAELKVCKYNDLNMNGMEDGADVRLPGWVMNVYDGSGNLVDSRPTGANGCYAWEVPAGDYRVCEVQQTGWVNTQAGNLKPGTAKNGEVCAHTQAIASGEKYTFYFGNYEVPPSINVCPPGTGGLVKTTVSGKGMFPKAALTVAIPKPAAATGLYVQLAGKQAPKSTYVRAEFSPYKGTNKLATLLDPNFESAAYRDYAVFWNGLDLTQYAGTATKVNGKLVVTAGSATNMPRALILYTDHPTPEETYNFVGLLDDSTKNHVYWQTGWFQKQVYTIYLPAPLTEARAIYVQAAVVDNDPDTRPFKLTIAVTNGGSVTKSFSPTGPNAGSMLNLIKTTLNAPVGTDRVVFTLESPIKKGDSVALVGTAVNYLCVLP
jgi:hypothetical protein